MSRRLVGRRGAANESSRLLGFYPVKATMNFMCVQCLQAGADLDFNESNFMLRSATGEILVTDPAHGL